MNKIMTLEDLYSFYSQQAVSTKFNVDTDHPAIAVTVPGRLTYEEDAQQIGLTPVVLNACHTGKNLNQSRISKEAMEDALPSFRNRPILGYIWKDEDGTYKIRMFKDGELRVKGIKNGENTNIIYINTSGRNGQVRSLDDLKTII